MATEKLTQLRNTDPGFYPALGPFLAAHAVHKALGGVPWDEDTKTWLVYTRAETVLGFCAVNEGTRRTLLESLYTPPEHEHLLPALVQAAVDRFGHDRDLHATVRNEIAPIHQAAGFKTVKEKETANFTVLVRRADVRNTK